MGKTPALIELLHRHGSQGGAHARELFRVLDPRTMEELGQRPFPITQEQFEGDEFKLTLQIHGLGELQGRIITVNRSPGGVEDQRYEYTIPEASPVALAFTLRPSELGLDEDAPTAVLEFVMDLPGGGETKWEQVVGLEQARITPVVECGEKACCSLADTGRLRCWGQGEVASPPEEYTERTLFTELSLGFDVACALTEEGEAKCWGNDADGAVSDTPAGDVRFYQISTGVSLACGVERDSEKARCWGLGAKPDTSEGRNDFDQGLPPQDVTWYEVWAGKRMSCGRRADDDVLQCWGLVEGLTPFAPFREIPTDWKPKKVALANDYVCGINPDELSVSCFGNVPDGLTGASPVDGGFKVKDLALGALPVMFLLYDVGEGQPPALAKLQGAGGPFAPGTPMESAKQSGGLNQAVNTLTVGLDTACGMVWDFPGMVHCWGEDTFGQVSMSL